MSDSEKSGGLYSMGGWVGGIIPTCLLGITHNIFLSGVCLNDSRGLENRVCECHRVAVRCWALL